MDDRALTFGEKAVGLTFNPSGSGLVNELKELYARIVDICDAQRVDTEDHELKRYWSVAITEAQTAQMWAVKAATWRG